MVRIECSLGACGGLMGRIGRGCCCGGFLWGACLGVVTRCPVDGKPWAQLQGLDGYKRQVQPHQWLLIFVRDRHDKRAAIPGRGRAAAFAPKAVCRGREPVSYTHLDVYKRQKIAHQHTDRNDDPVVIKGGYLLPNIIARRGKTNIDAGQK